MTASLLFHPSPDAVYGFANARRVERVDSPYQRIEIWDTAQLGALFTLDGRPMTSAGDEFIYHECMVHPALLAHPSPRSALVLGGGDGGAARQLLRHACIERIVVAELDAEVVRLTRTHLPSVHGGAFDDPRVELVIGDAAAYVARAAAERTTASKPAHTPGFDHVVFDLTPPDSPAASLYTPDFFRQIKRVMSRDATVSLHLGSPYFHPARVAALLRDLGAAFAAVRTLGAFVPLYGSLWLMAIASDALDPASPDATALLRRMHARGVAGLRFYDPSTHPSLFSVAEPWRDKLGRILEP